MNLASPSASGSSWCMARGSKNTLSASAKDTPCFLRLVTPLAGSNRKPTIDYMYNMHIGQEGPRSQSTLAEGQVRLTAQGTGGLQRRSRLIPRRARVERVLQAVAEEVEGDDGDEDEEAGI